jgi:hypothetical protein
MFHKLPRWLQIASLIEGLSMAFCLIAAAQILKSAFVSSVVLSPLLVPIYAMGSYPVIASISYLVFYILTLAQLEALMKKEGSFVRHLLSAGIALGLCNLWWIYWVVKKTPDLFAFHVSC